MSTKETTAGKRDGNEAETKGQWSVRPLNPYQAEIFDGAGKRMATVGEFSMNLPGQAEGIAGKIVRAVNAHDELVNACKEAFELLSMQLPDGLPAMRKIRAAIDKAEGVAV